MAIYFTSDTHFFHENIIPHCDRPFENLEHMHQVLVDNWNSVVRKADVVYHLGDFAFTRNSSIDTEVTDLMSNLNGNKFLVNGNHDRKTVTRNKKWSKVTPYHEISIDIGSTHRQLITMSHYPLLYWNKMRFGSYMLHGHCHGTLKEDHSLRIDVGVDCNDFTPISLSQVIERMRNKT